MRRIFLLLLFLQMICIVLAGIQVQIKPEPLWVLPVLQESTRDPNPKDVSNGYFYALVNRQVNLMNQTVYLHYIRHIVNESGVQGASEVSVNFAPQFQQVVYHRVAIIRNGSSISQLSSSSIKLADEESNVSDYEYNGIKRAYLILKDVQKGDLVDVAYSIIGFNPVFEGRYAEDFYFDSPTPVANYYLSIMAQPWRKLHIKTFNRASLPAEKTESGLKCYQWKNPVLFRGSTESNIPSWFTQAPYVSISEFENWSGVVDWGLKIFNDYQYSLPSSLLKKVDSWRKAAGGDPDMFTNLALRFVQDQVRYLGLEIGSYTHQPHTPETVYNLRFGDCKDKALLLAAILRHEHIAAFVALTNTYERGNLAMAAPSPIAFNHAIVALPRSSGYVFVDPTISLQRGELINAFIPDFGLALILKSGENQLVSVEPGFLQSVSVTEELNIHFNDDTSSLNVTSLYKGGAADDFRETLSQSSLQEIAVEYLKYYAKIFDGVLSNSPVEIVDDSLKNEITVHESYQIPKIWQRRDAGKLSLDVYAKLIASKIPDPAAHGDTIPISLDFPLSEEYILKMNLPEDWPLDMKALHIKNGSYQFDFTPVYRGDHLIFTYYFKTFRDYIPGEEVRQYKTDYKEMDKWLSLGFTKTDLSSPAPGTKSNPKPASHINWITLWLSFFFGVLFTILFRFLNKRTNSEDQRSNAAMPLGGWIIVLGITLMISMALQGYNFWNEHYYLKSTWIIMEKMGGTKLQSVFIFEMILSLFSMAGLGALLFWFFGRRDIFPSMFIYYAGIFLAAQFILLLIYYHIRLPDTLASLRKDMITQFFRMAIYTAVWVSFVMRSKNVKYTFVYPHGRF